MDNDAKSKLIVDTERLRLFLGRNQLVQANALAQKLETVMLKIAMSESKPAELENHPLWPARRSAYFVQSEILRGKTAQAVEEAAKLSQLLRKDVAE